MPLQWSATTSTSTLTSKYKVIFDQIQKKILSWKESDTESHSKPKILPNYGRCQRWKFCKCTRINGIFCYLSLISGVLIRSFPIFSLLSIVSLPLSFIWEIEGYPIHSENSIIILIKFPSSRSLFQDQNAILYAKKYLCPN